MPYKKSILTLLLSVVIILAFGVDSHAGFPCKECHSKRPGAVAMHKAVRGDDCFICHVRGEKLRQKGGIPKEKHETFLRQRTTMRVVSSATTAKRLILQKMCPRMNLTGCQEILTAPSAILWKPIC